MPDETLRIVIQDEGGVGGSAPVTSSAGIGGGSAPVSGGTGAFAPVAPLQGAANATIVIAGAAKALGAVAQAAVGVVRAFDALNSFVENQANLVSPFSPDVQAAQVRAQIRQQRLLVNRAQRIGPQLARAEETRARFEELQFQITTEILKVLLDLFDLAKGQFDALVANLEPIKQIRAAFDELPIFLQASLRKASPVLDKTLKALDALVAATETPKGGELDINVQAIFDSLPRSGDESRAPLFWPDGLPIPGEGG